MKLILQRLGTVWLIGIETDNHEERQAQYWSLWNHGATSGELHWLTDGNAYFWTTEKDLKKAVINATLFELWNKHPEMEDDEQASERLAHPIADERFEAVENKPDLVSFAAGSGAVYATEVDLEDYNWNGTKKARV